MKRCPDCRRDYFDDSLMYCLEDGAALVSGVPDGSDAHDWQATEILRDLPASRTRDDRDHEQIDGSKLPGGRRALAVVIAASIVLLGTSGYFGYRWSRPLTEIRSLAVLPFTNESGNPDLEYLSDGMTESLIISLARLPRLSVKPRSSVFRFKGKEIDDEQVASQLSVQAILSGRVVQRNDDLVLYLRLVDGRTGYQIWGEQYERKLAGLVALQGEIARDVSNKLQVRLSKTEEQLVSNNYTQDTEAYQLYLRGRYHVSKMKPTESDIGISYFQQAIKIDPSYALAYVGLAEAYRSFVISGEMAPADFMPLAKSAAQKAIEIDETLAAAHASLALITLWNQTDWAAAEHECTRALELDPNLVDAHIAYAQLLLTKARYAEAASEMKRARELDPLNLRTNTLEGVYLSYAGQVDAALDRLQKTIELDQNFWFAHMWASSIYSDKAMFPEAISEAEKARNSFENSTFANAFLGYALARSGQTAGAESVVRDLVKLSSERNVPPYHIALVYNGLGRRDDAIAWLERAYQQRDPKLVFLKAEPKWNNLRDDPQFRSLIKRLNFPE